MFGACSSDDVVVDDQPGVATPGEKGYVNLSINLPTQPSSRANDVFDNGDEKEYNVNNAYLFLFKGASEASATFQSGYELTTGSWNDQANGSNITTYASIVQEITKPSITGSDKLYALVVLNGNGVITKGGTAEAPTFKYGSYDFTVNSTKLSDLTSNALSGLNLSTVANLDNDGNFLMSNAPLFSKPGGTTDPAGGTVSTLAEVNPDLIYTERAQAEKGAAAANIYVERAVAKVSLNQATVTGQTTVDNLAYTIVGWDLDVTNTKTYLVRNVAPQTSWWGYKSDKTGEGVDFRFVGSSAVASNLYRTYWGIDLNYDRYDATDFTVHEGTYDNLKDTDVPLYCFENTFNVEQMRQDRTTQVIVAADFNVKGEGVSFYTIRGDKSETNLLDKAGAEAAVKEAYLKTKAIDDAIRNAKMVNTESKIDKDDLEVTFDKDGGYLTVTEIKLTDDAVKKFADTDDDGQPNVPEILTAENQGHKDVVKAVSDDVRVACYEGGRSYYHALIQHFGDSQTPWETSDANGTESYGTNEKNFLGRWGVLRNNWYQLSVTGIAELGEPEVPEIPGTYDDPTESWIRVQINVLSWAVRTQNVGL